MIIGSNKYLEPNQVYESSIWVNSPNIHYCGNQRYLILRTSNQKEFESYWKNEGCHYFRRCIYYYEISID